MLQIQNIPLPLDGGAELQVVAYGRIPSEAIPELKSCRGVKSVLIK